MYSVFAIQRELEHSNYDLGYKKGRVLWTMHLITDNEIISTAINTFSIRCRYWTCSMTGGVQNLFGTLISQV